MDAMERWHMTVWSFMRIARLAETADEKRRVVLAAFNAVDAAYADRTRKMPRETSFEVIRRFAEGMATLTALHEAGKRVRSAVGDFATDPKLYGFATAAHRLATVMVASDDAADGGFRIQLDEIPFLLGWLTYGRPSQSDAKNWEDGVAKAIVHAYESNAQ